MQQFQQNVIATYKHEGQAWLRALPRQLAQLQDKLHITLTSPFNSLTYHYVVGAQTQDGQAVVLKCGVPNPELRLEINALQFYEGQSSVRLIDSDADEGWMLMERICPGDVLTSIKDDDKRTRIAVEVMQRFWPSIQPHLHSFISIAAWLDGLKQFKAAYCEFLLSQRQINYAIDAASDLLTSQGEPVLLHGDLHHDNILKAERLPWLAIDPKGVIGEREYEYGALLRHPQPFIFNHDNPKALCKRRIDIITEMTGLYRQRLLLWAFVQAVLSVWWMIEDGVSGTKEMIRITQILYELYQRK